MTAGIKKTVALRDMPSCNLVDRYQCFRRMRWLCHHSTRVSYPEDGGSKVLSNVGIHSLDYMASHLGRQ
jgi:hypothetical protein